jgi:hypothetical protein
MKRSSSLSIVLAVVIAGLAQAQGGAEPVEDMPKVARPLDSFMRRKLELSKDALKGIVTEDFPLIKKTAEGLEKMSRQAEWEVFHLDEYNHFSAEFRRIARSMAKQAENKNIDGSALAYMQLTMSCVECHKFTRGVKMADVVPVKK